MVYLLVDCVAESFYQSQTDNYIISHGHKAVCNDYISTTVSNGVVRLQFQPSNQRPVVVVVNGLANSPSHQQWELLVNHGGYGDTDFSQEIADWRSIIDSVQPPSFPLELRAPRRLENAFFEFTYTGGSAGRTYRLEASQNLTNWSSLRTGLPASTSTPTTVQVTNAPAYTYHFYRMVEE